MKPHVKPYASLIAALLLTMSSGAACRTADVATGPQIIQPGAPGEASRVVDVDEATDLSKVQHTPADVKFMQGMIGHHAQAVEMVALLPSRTASADLKLLGQRITVSQEDEIKMMQDWLRARGQTVPTGHEHHMPGADPNAHVLMPGMLTAEEMSRLAAAQGAEFDRLFLEGMIKHHIGALTMVKELFSTAGAGQEADLNAFASEVDADQRMEIDRMGAMLNALPKEL